VNEFLDCVRGLVRPLVTFALVAALILLAWYQQVGIGVIPAELRDLTLITIGYWFGGRRGQQ
jgi:biotin transporter BioY